MQVSLTPGAYKEWSFRAVLRTGSEVQGTVVEGGKLNRRETEYRVKVDGGRSWRVILLAMPNRGHAWRIADEHHRSAGAGDSHASPELALQNGAIPYLVEQDRPEH